MSTFLEQALDGLPDRLRDALAQVDTRVRDAQAEVDRLKAERMEIARVLKAVDPTYRERAGTKRDGVLSGRPKMVSETKLDAIEAYLRETFGPDKEFYATGLSSRPDWQFGSQSHTSHALRLLNDRGAIRLDYIAKQGGAKHYKLVTRGGTDGEA